MQLTCFFRHERNFKDAHPAITFSPHPQVETSLFASRPQVMSWLSVLRFATSTVEYSEASCRPRWALTSKHSRPPSSLVRGLRMGKIEARMRMTKSHVVS